MLDQLKRTLSSERPPVEMRILSERRGDGNDPDRIDRLSYARNRALAIAYAKALADAETLAEAAGLTLGHPENISTGPQRAPVFRAMNRDAPVAMSAEMAPRYEPGQLSVSASVSVIFTATP